MTDNETVFNKIAEALMIDYTSVYYVNAVTGEYRWYSADPEFRSLQIAREGKDFFLNMKRDAEQVVYEDDKHIFNVDMQKENLFAALKSGGMQSMKYRLMIHGKPVYHSLRIIRGINDGTGDEYFVIGVINIDREVRMREEAEKLRAERETYNQIAISLADDYNTIYYVDLDTGKFFEFSSNEQYKALKVPTRGQDFFAETRENVERFVFPDDKKFALSLYYKDTMMKNLTNRKSFSYSYRLIFSGKVVHYRFTVMPSGDGKHLIVCVKDISDEISAENAMRAKQRINITYGQIAESLASNYDVIYYVNISDGTYAGYTSNPIYGKLELQEEGNDFFTDLKRNSELLVHPQDKERVLSILDRDHMITSLSDRKQYSADYRLIVDGRPQYTRVTIMRSSDAEHIIIGVENVDAETRKEKEQIKALNNANALARRDELTGTKNKTAYTELERSVQANIDNGLDYLPFAIVVCDINGLKQINDAEGHKAGDEYIRACASLICSVFAHSPVFRIGGDEFAAFIRGDDYSVKEALFEKLRSQVLMNLGRKGAPVIASGIAEYDPVSDRKIAAVFERADNMMYENKRDLKEKGSL